MAIKLISNYAKRLGLPGYSSHQFSVSVETELTDLERAPAEIARLYQTLQHAVDREIIQTGFVPGEDYGMNTAPAAIHGGNSNGNHANGTNGNSSNGNGSGDSNGNHQSGKVWSCSPKQRNLITDLQKQLGLSDSELDERSLEFFSKTANQLNKLSASGLITALLEEAGKSNRNRNGHRNGNGSAVPAKGGN